MKIEDLPNIAVNVDSDTARAIAEQYIHFKYVENFTFATVIVLLLILVGSVIRWVIKSS